LARSYPGGTEFYIANAWTSHISDFSSIEPHLLLTVPSPTRILSQFGMRATELDPEALFAAFFGRTGVPCPAELENGKQHFNPVVLGELSNVDSIAFRPRMFCWAATGSPFLDCDQSMPIHVDFVLPGDPAYGDNRVAANMRYGTISFATCSRIARIPISKLVELQQADYPTEKEATFEDAVDNWFLLQILNGIRTVSMI